jgi:hypothetical protein
LGKKKRGIISMRKRESHTGNREFKPPKIIEEAQEGCRREGKNASKFNSLAIEEQQHLPVQCFSWKS